MLTKPRYASMAAEFIGSTGLIGQYQALDEDQSCGFTGVGSQNAGTGDYERAPARSGTPLHAQSE